MQSTRCRLAMYRKVKELDVQIFRPIRAGIVPVVDLFGEKYYCFGVDHKYQEITDFGGGIRYKRDENVLYGALREFSEESLGIFGYISPTDLQEDDAIFDKDTLIIFHRDDEIDINRKAHLFSERYKRQTRPEVSDVIWFSHEEVKQLVYGETPIRPNMHTYGCIHSNVQSFNMYDKIKWLLRQSRYFEK